MEFIIGLIAAFFIGIVAVIYFLFAAAIALLPILFWVLVIWLVIRLIKKYT